MYRDNYITRLLHPTRSFQHQPVRLPYTDYDAYLTQPYRDATCIWSEDDTPSTPHIPIPPTSLAHLARARQVQHKSRRLMIIHVTKMNPYTTAGDITTSDGYLINSYVDS